jgi:hypothetical protein
MGYDPLQILEPGVVRRKRRRHLREIIAIADDMFRRLVVLCSSRVAFGCRPCSLSPVGSIHNSLRRLVGLEDTSSVAIRKSSLTQKGDC